MGYIENITFEKYPKQSNRIGKRVKVCYHYNTSKCHYGIIIRDDTEEPFEGIIKLDNGRIIKMTECQYTNI